MNCVLNKLASKYPNLCIVQDVFVICLPKVAVRLEIGIQERRQSQNTF